MVLTLKVQQSGGIPRVNVLSIWILNFDGLANLSSFRDNELRFLRAKDFSQEAHYELKGLARYHSYVSESSTRVEKKTEMLPFRRSLQQVSHFRRRHLYPSLHYQTRWELKRPCPPCDAFFQTKHDLWVWCEVCLRLWQLWCVLWRTTADIDPCVESFKHFSLFNERWPKSSIWGSIIKLFPSR